MTTRQSLTADKRSLQINSYKAGKENLPGVLQNIPCSVIHLFSQLQFSLNCLIFQGILMLESTDACHGLSGIPKNEISFH